MNRLNGSQPPQPKPGGQQIAFGPSSREQLGKYLWMPGKTLASADRDANRRQPGVYPGACSVTGHHLAIWHLGSDHRTARALSYRNVH